MKKIKFALIFLVLTFLLVSCGDPAAETESVNEQSDSDLPAGIITSESSEGESSAEDAVSGESLSIVVLGDSIARGYGLENPETERFSSLLGEKLKSHYAEVKVSNFAVDGQTGAELAASLESDIPNELKECDIVIISIGGNNVLGSLTEVSGLVELFSDVPQKIFTDYFYYMFPPEGTQKDSFQYAVDAVTGFLKSANGVFQSDAYKNLVKKGGENLEKEIPDIVSHIKKVNPDARILYQTVYNPYKNVNISLIGIEEKLDLSVYGEQAVSPMNAAINSLAADQGYDVVPVSERFEDSRRSLTNAGFDLFKLEIGFDPHPNSAGHSYIADIYYEFLTEGDDA